MCVLRLLACVAVLAWLSLSPAPASAADRKQGKSYALLVGVKEYDHDSLRDLKHTENDVEELANVLREQGRFDKVVVLTSTRGKGDAGLKPTARNIREQLRKLAEKVTKHDLILVGLAGHGLQIRVEDPRTKKERDESFFCPTDARPKNGLGLAELSKTLIPMGEMFRELAESGAGTKLILIDACRNDIKASARNMEVDNLPASARGVAALFSCKGGERAFESDKLGKGHGVFFHYVIEALRGKARNDKGDITWSRLAEYVIEKVSDEVPTLIGDGARQTPQELKNQVGKTPVLIRSLGDPENWFLTGVKYDFGQGVAADHAEAARWYRQAADRGHAPAMNNLGALYSNSLLGERDHAEALKWFRKAAGLGQVRAMVNLGDAHFYGRGVGPDRKEALAWYRKAADRGDRVGEYYVGWMYRYGHGVEKKDPVEALKWLRKAAAKDHPGAMYDIGKMYEAGAGVERDMEEALKWHRKAAAGGEPNAMVSVGNYHYYAWAGLTTDHKEAVKWYRLAAARENPTGLFYLGWMYYHGEGVEQKDAAEALKWYRKAAAKGEPTAMDWIGLMYDRGEVVAQDTDEAVRWYRRSAEAGAPSGMFNYARALENGRGGLAKDQAEALKWYRKAAALNDPNAKKALERLGES